MIQQTTRIFCLLAAFAASATPALAEPSRTAWLEDASLPAADTSESVLDFEHQLTDIKARGEGIDQLGLALRTGLSDSFAVAPRLSFRQRGEEPLRLDSVGFQLRWHFLDDDKLPKLMGYGGYANDLDDERDHLIGAGLAASYNLGPLLLNADVRPTLSVGGDAGSALETWYGLGLGYGWFSSVTARAGIETFFVMPVTGSRLYDPTFGEAAESNTFYYGPSFALASGPFWTSASLATGYFVPTPASQFMLRWVVGIEH
jgi:hypothetical protein